MHLPGIYEKTVVLFQKKLSAVYKIIHFPALYTDKFQILMPVAESLHIRVAGKLCFPNVKGNARSVVLDNLRGILHHIFRIHQIKFHLQFSIRYTANFALRCPDKASKREEISAEYDCYKKQGELW